ncbi:hypothetical protein Adeg_2105 [Ammonifex degensii KC4]|uniref:Uncharacterized protein n=1 Tax=Ammonifex degensii (strain DSM 10501 / KC4) TaxID=429009 RepID=C9RA53_AMMDK|nr:hypothetical protein [Ammonifex degensii]ACX53182.1 hypothetical protein Adeg_2105 [Ammonifex degensii KC4]
MSTILANFLTLLLLALASRKNADRALDNLALLAQNTSEAIRKLRQGLELMQQAISEAKKIA